MKKYKYEKELLKDTLLKDGEYKSTKEVFERIAKYQPDAKILAELDDDNNIIYHTSSEILETIEALGDGLLKMGLKGKHIAIIADNSYRYVICDMTIAGGVGVVTPIDKDADIELMSTLLNLCDADAVICSSHLLEKIKLAQKKCSSLKTIYTIDKKIDDFLSFDEIVKLGKEKINAGKYRSQNLDLNATCKILFTSGTTGMNKGVELSQNNLAANIINCLDVIKVDTKKDNTSMSILPMHHSTEINTHIMPRIAAGRLTYINGSMKDMMRNIKIFKPYIITVVPMVANAFYKTIWQQAKKQGKDKKLKKGIKLCKIARLFGFDLTRKLFGELFAPFGGNLTQIICGGSSLNPEVVKGFRDIGVFIINGYGITECGPLVSMNTETVKEVYSVGKACPKLEIKIAEPDEFGVGELCVKGKSVSQRYYKDEEGTKMVHDADGFFHTGDLAYKDKEGRIFLSGRKKNLIILDSGKNVYPEELERDIVNGVNYIKEVVVFEGKCQLTRETKNQICALVYLDPEAGEINSEKIIEDFRKLNQKLPQYKRITYVEVTDREFLKNATKKVIRKPAIERHSEIGGLII